MTLRPHKGRRLLVALSLGIAGLFTLSALASSPPFIYPSTPSVPVGVYGRIFEEPSVGHMASFPMPAAARRYQESLGHKVSKSFRVMKPIVAGPGDHVCNSVADGLRVNDVWLGNTSAHDTMGHALPHWSRCKRLGADEFFMMSDFVPNSFDSRYFGPVSKKDILGVYKPLF